MKDITIIIPINDFSKETGTLLKNAVKSIPAELPVIFSCKSGEADNVKKMKAGEGTIVATSKGDSFQELVNAAVKEVETKWFSILEYDDEYTEIWLPNAEKYIEFKPETSVFMFFEDIKEDGTDKYIGMGNESPWASSFSEEIGYLDNGALQNYFDYYMTGSIFNKADWEEVGGLKPLIKVTFWYEWLLRATKNNKSIFVIPKIGYNHLMGRKGSLTDIYQTTMKNAEIEWWFDLAKKDYFYKEQKDADYYVYKESAKNED